MQPGEYLETAIWLTGTETEAELHWWKTEKLPESIKEAAHLYDVTFSPLEFEELKPGDNRVPPVPDHISGPDVRLLVAWCQVVKAKRKKFTAPPWRFQLSPEDLERLRAATRQAAFKVGHILTDEECDELIEQVGPTTAEAAIRAAVDSGMLH